MITTLCSFLGAMGSLAPVVSIVLKKEHDNNRRKREEVFPMKTAAKVHQQRIKNASYREALRQWFSEGRWKKVYPILTSQDDDDISLRVLEFLTDPAFVEECRLAQVPLSYYIVSADGKQQRLFNLPVQMMEHQAVRRKKYMEPFARQNHDLENGGRFEFGFEDHKVETNVAQLQFLKFLIENNVLEWVRKHKATIFDIKGRCDRQKTAAKKRRRRASSEEGDDDETVASPASAPAPYIGFDRMSKRVKIVTGT